VIARLIDPNERPAPIETPGMRIRLLRTARGWSQERLAEEAGVDRQTVGLAERDVVEMYAWTLDAITAALGATMDDVWRGRP
jgi:transcriptional regulator with XRE-family HTH domain